MLFFERIRYGAVPAEDHEEVELWLPKQQQQAAAAAGAGWGRTRNAASDYHAVCQGFFKRRLDTALLEEMLGALMRAKAEYMGVASTLRFLRQNEIDMDNDMRRRVVDLTECVEHAAAVLGGAHV